MNQKLRFLCFWGIHNSLPSFWAKLGFSRIKIDHMIYHFIADSLLKDAVLTVGLNLRLCLRFSVVVCAFSIPIFENLLPKMIFSQVTIRQNVTKVKIQKFHFFFQLRLVFVCKYLLLYKSKNESQTFLPSSRRSFFFKI